MTAVQNSFAAQLSALLRTMPGLTSTAAEQADWYERKADLLERAAGNSHVDTAEAAELAAIACTRAAELRERRS